MKLELRITSPESEFSEEFLQGMLNRMSVSFHKYGYVKDAYPHRVNAIECLQQRIDSYFETGNTEYLMDVANFAMIEFMHPAHENAFFKGTDSDGSPGRITTSGDVTDIRNEDINV